MSTSIQDMKGGMSDCCGALVYFDLEMCSDCKEHCGIITEEDCEEVELNDADLIPKHLEVDTK